MINDKHVFYLILFILILLNIFCQNGICTTVVSPIVACCSAENMNRGTKKLLRDERVAEEIDDDHTARVTEEVPTTDSFDIEKCNPLYLISK